MRGWGGGGVAGSQPMSTAIHSKYTGAQITPYLSYEVNLLSSSVSSPLVSISEADFCLRSSLLFGWHFTTCVTETVSRGQKRKLMGETTNFVINPWLGFKSVIRGYNIFPLDQPISGFQEEATDSNASIGGNRIPDRRFADVGMQTSETTYWAQFEVFIWLSNYVANSKKFLI
jgi:hypothetical protein